MKRPDDLPSEDQIGYWYWGETGSGKTYAAIHEFPDAYRKIANNKWWDGYQNEDFVIIDDLDKAHNYMGYHLKIWGDRYAFAVETKGGYRYIRPKKIVVTSNYPPEHIWEDSTTLGPIRRRFKVVHFRSLQDPILPAQDEEREHHKIIARRDEERAEMEEIDNFFNEILDDI